MTAHPRGPRDPKKPTKSRHIVEKAKTVKQDARGSQEIMARDTMRALAWLNEAPLRTITSQGMRDWVAQQDPPWTRGYWVAIKGMVQTALADDVAATGAETRTRLLKMIDVLVPECRGYRFGNGGGDAGTVVLRDPKTQELLYEIDHKAVQGYVKIYAQLSGLLTEKHQHLHLHTAMSNGGDLSEVPEEELIEAERITNQGASP